MSAAPLSPEPSSGSMRPPLAQQIMAWPGWKLWLLVLGALGVVIGALVLAGAAPADAAQQILVGSLGSPGAISATLKEMTPLLIAGAAVFIGLRAGLFNIGVEGQFLVGAAASAYVALAIPNLLGLLLAVTTGCLAGGLWAFPAGWIRAYRGGHEVITTIMLNNIAALMTAWLVAGPMKAPGQQSTTTANLPPAVRLPFLHQDPPLFVSSALVIGLLIVAFLAFWLRKTVKGYELQAVGANPKAAAMAGVATPRVLLGAMVTSGAIAGLAGALHVVAYEGRFYQGFSPGYGFDALGVALLAGGAAGGVVPAAFLFAVLSRGSASLTVLMGIPKGISAVLVGLLIIVFAAVRYRQPRRRDD
jgi:general nucleoside transport system permease protein